MKERADEHPELRPREPVRSPASALFDGYSTLPAVVEAVLEGRQGTAAIDGGAARLTLGCYELFAGDPRSAGARRLVATAPRPRELVYGNDAGWRTLIAEVHAGRVTDRPMTEFDAGGLDPDVLARAAAPPDGFVVERLDVAIATQLDEELEPHALQVFASATDFAARGVGFGALREGRLVAASTSYTLSSRRVEIAVATRVAFRGRGLAATVAAALLAHCLRHGLTPAWSASNPVSKRLAQRLGFRPAGTCEVLYLS